MKFFTLFFALCLFLPVTGAYGAEKLIQKSASAFVATPMYEFEPVADGTEITHDFIIQNKGNAFLKVEKVKSG
ncbi:MAG: hypothetical protein HQ542_14395 [Bacteroidia bacterium]|nr:hypothetical protein [Bacteroidia bacterium]